VKKGVRLSAEVSAAKDEGSLIVCRSRVETVIARSASLAIMVATLLLFDVSINGHITATSILGALCIIISLSFYRAATFKHLSFNLHTSRNSRPGQESRQQSPEIFHSDADDVVGNTEIGNHLHFGKIENGKRGMSGDRERAHKTVRRVRNPTNHYVH
jgi:hypothetical protein